jgi:Fe-S oxidoreductase
MTTTYDPHHPMYLDEAQTRTALAQAFDVCDGCRKCVDLCPSFPAMFRYVSQGGPSDAGQMTPAQQDHVVDECFQCKLCVVGCPYGPGQHETAHHSASSYVLDIPRLMLRADAMRYANGHATVRDKLSSVLIGHADLVGKLSVRMARFVNRLIGAKPGSVVRRLLAVLTGVASNRVLPLFAELRFSAWFDLHPKVRVGKKQGRVTVFPTCVVEYQEPAIGQALVRVYEHNGIECGLSKSACCGAGYLHSGNLAAFTKIAVDNVATLAAEVRKGNDIVVPQPACSYVLKHDYVDYVGGPDAQLVAQHTYDAAEYLMKVHRTEGSSLDVQFTGEVPDTIAYHAASHLRAQKIGLQSRDLLKLMGAKVNLVEQSSGVESLAGLRRIKADSSQWASKLLGLRVGHASAGHKSPVVGGDAVHGDVVCGDCHLSNTAIAEQTGKVPLHPLQLLARAYGFASD